MRFTDAIDWMAFSLEQQNQRDREAAYTASLYYGTGKTMLPSSLAYAYSLYYKNMTWEALTVERDNVQALIFAKRQAIRNLRLGVFWRTQPAKRRQRRQLHSDLSDLEGRHAVIVDALLRAPRYTNYPIDKALSKKIRLFINKVYDEEDLSFRGIGSDMGPHRYVPSSSGSNQGQLFGHLHAHAGHHHHYGHHHGGDDGGDGGCDGGGGE